MNKFYIQGPTILNGEIKISGSKNSALPILFLSLLSKSPIKISNVPKIKDVTIAIKLLTHIGVKIKFSDVIIFDASHLTTCQVPYKLVRKIRASIWLLSPLLIRFKKVCIDFPGGCSIGSRPINLHIYGLKKLGAKFIINKNYIKVYTTKNLQGTIIYMPLISVGATITVIGAAILANGITIIKNAAREPEITDLVKFLNKLGAKIFGVGTSTIYIQGVNKLHSEQYYISPDRIETGTFLIAAAISKGNITCTHTNPNVLKSVINILCSTGAKITCGKTWINLNMYNKRPKSVNVCTSPYPGFPTDLQPQITLLNLIAVGNSIITETIFENRYTHISELTKMGAKNKTKKNLLKCYGVNKLFGNYVIGKDLRSTATLILAGCIAEGITIVNNIFHVRRGYERIEKKLNSLGAKITLI
ncbi:UDP-N-acetylglucosamine 1-carboxyvinyltransferase [Buchnera aphidicola (Nipponaphis monzeni)]|uniref:UDP-N-acetylglucosamine 1-carboxyvinyltransferase n=1 Tax=Buchnera aphidicola (Nipponaphis monzeni) TaxID=2495405 RepID=A0A455TAD7_9GAMM|nr:UDP-N-acetylglucosamine 1-carboxyvinyltransferase [Buchnera aphidicola]BBI01304.1 UDP-N-acetylglucosamine 1-carboxyvinyltransferase [Buchnera aphidicola (Nipponaphis monzeni)]